MRIFYFPVFYKSLKKEPRKSGFLAPNLGNSTQRGQFFGVGYFWAINRSYDMTYDATYYTAAGLAQHLSFRGDPNARTKMDFRIEGMKDELPTQPSGAIALAHITSELGDGWQAKGVLDYISSFPFRADFSASYADAINSQTHSVGFVTKHWADYGVTFVAQQNVNYLQNDNDAHISVRKLPEADFVTREHEFDILKWPFWFSMDSSAGLLARSEPLVAEPAVVPRMDFSPHVTTAFRWAGIQLVPTLGIRETYYSGDYNPAGTIGTGGVLRNSRDVSISLILPSLERIYDAPVFLGKKIKHVIEPRMTYKDVSGIDNFNRILRFDESDILSNTNQVGLR